MCRSREPVDPETRFRNPKAQTLITPCPELQTLTSAMNEESGGSGEKKIRRVMCGAYVHGTDPYLPGNDV